MTDQRKIDEALRLRIAMLSARAWGILGKSPDLSPFQPDDEGKAFALRAERVTMPPDVPPIDPVEWLGIRCARIRVSLNASGVDSKAQRDRFWSLLCHVDSVLIGNFAPLPTEGRYWDDPSLTECWDNPSLTEYARWPFLAIASPGINTFYFHLPIAAVPERDSFGIDLRLNSTTGRAWLVMPLSH